MTSTSTAWRPDAALPGFEATTLHFPADYDGPVTATLVRRSSATPNGQAVLYIHGYMDYFFQAHLADYYLAHGFSFYALDLRKYGRSLGEGRHPNFCKDLREYFPEISAALRLMTMEDGQRWVVVNGHSTGGLTAALYAAGGPERARISALVLNSPFFAFNADRRTRAVIQAAAELGGVLPFGALRGRRPIPYIESIHRDYHGRWSFDLRWRPLQGFPIFFGWLRAIGQGHRWVRRGLPIGCPVLVLHADHSVRGARWHAGFQRGDAVLNVADIAAGSWHLGGQVTTVPIADGLHDLFLSRPEVELEVAATMFAWLSQHAPAPAPTFQERP